MRNRQDFDKEFNLDTMFPTGDFEWNDIVCPALGLATGLAAPTIAVSSGIRYYAFSGGTSGTADELHGVFEMLHDYVEETDCELHAHWFPVNNATGNVILGVDYAICKVHEAPIYVTGVTVLARTIASDETGIHHVNNVAIIPGAGMRIGANIMFRIYRPRIVTNTYGASIGMLTIGLHYRVNSLGSKEVSSK